MLWNCEGCGAVRGFAGEMDCHGCGIIAPRDVREARRIAAHAKRQAEVTAHFFVVGQGAA